MVCVPVVLMKTDRVSPCLSLRKLFQVSQCSPVYLLYALLSFASILVCHFLVCSLVRALAQTAILNQCIESCFWYVYMRKIEVDLALGKERPIKIIYDEEGGARWPTVS